jgi:hypothetical protein
MGNVVLKIDLGTLLDRKEGKITMNIDVDSKGFTEKYLIQHLEEMFLKLILMIIPTLM